MALAGRPGLGTSERLTFLPPFLTPLAAKAPGEGSSLLVAAVDPLTFFLEGW